MHDVARLTTQERREQALADLALARKLAAAAKAAFAWPVADAPVEAASAVANTPAFPPVVETGVRPADTPGPVPAPAPEPPSAPAVRAGRRRARSQASPAERRAARTRGGHAANAQLRAERESATRSEAVAALLTHPQVNRWLIEDSANDSGIYACPPWTRVVFKPAPGVAYSVEVLEDEPAAAPLARADALTWEEALP